MTLRLPALLLNMIFLSALIPASAMQAQPQFSIRAASIEPVEGWESMRVERCQGSRCTIWVSPTAVLVASDIEKAEPNHTSPDGAMRIAVVFTDAGAKKMADLTTAQLHKYMAMILDGKVIQAPLIMAEFHPGVGKQGMLAGSGPKGLTQQEVERILALVK